MESSLRKAASLDSSRPDQTVENENQDLAGLKVLLVDDSADNRNLVELYLKCAGATVALAENGKLGVQRALTEDFDVVLMDIQMPIVDGNFAMAVLKKKGYLKPVIALTVHSMAEERENSMQNGFTDYMTKPIAHSTLVRGLRKFKIKSK